MLSATRALIRFPPVVRRVVLSSSSPARFLGTTSPDEKEKSPDVKSSSIKTSKGDRKSPLLSFGDSVARGSGQVIFLNSPTSGIAILGSLALGDPYLAALATVGTLSATAAAQCLDPDALKDGLYGYNGCLVGCATAVFNAPSSLFLSGLVTTSIASAATPFVAAALKPAMGSVPQWTLAFNIVTLTMLLRLSPFKDAPPAAPYQGSIMDLVVSAPLKGVSEIFVVDSSVTGAALLSSMAITCSPGLAAHTLMGATVGALTGWSVGAPLEEISLGLWGFNSALTSMACGVFFVHSPATMAVSVGGAAATAALFGAMKSMFGIFDAPCLTLPFCITMSGCYLLSGTMAGLRLASNPHSPEKNE